MSLDAKFFQWKATASRKDAEARLVELASRPGPVAEAIGILRMLALDDIFETVKSALEQAEPKEKRTYLTALQERELFLKSLLGKESSDAARR